MMKKSMKMAGSPEIIGAPETVKTGQTSSLPNTFPVNTKFKYSSFPYVGNFQVTQAHKDTGSEFRRIMGGENGNDDAVVDLHKLQKDLASGKIEIIPPDPLT